MCSEQNEQLNMVLYEQSKQAVVNALLKAP